MRIQNFTRGTSFFEGERNQIQSKDWKLFSEVVRHTPKLEENKLFLICLTVLIELFYKFFKLGIPADSKKSNSRTSLK